MANVVVLLRLPFAVCMASEAVHRQGELLEIVFTARLAAFASARWQQQPDQDAVIAITTSNLIA